LVLGASEKFKIADYLHQIDKTQPAQVFSCEIGEVNTFIDSYSAADRTRAFLKVQDGCDYTCSFCTIPLARGKSRSNSIENVVGNAKNLAEKGIKEIVLTGVNIGDFGKGNQTEDKRKQENFLQLIVALDKVKEIERFRISSIEPNLLNNEIIEFVAESNKFVPHFHIPLQSGSNKILAAMRRRYQRELYADKVTQIKSLMPHCCIGVDVITGFPSETEDDFLETEHFLSHLPISYLHVFTYSERSYTHALSIKPVVPLKERQERNKMLRMLSEKKKQHFSSIHIGETRKVLFESANKNGFISGYTDNYIKIKQPFMPSLINQLADVKINAENIDNSI